MKVGDEVIVELIGNEARNKSEEEVFVVDKVKKVGQKYFYLEGYRFTRERFVIETGYVDGRGYSENFRVFKSMDEALENRRILKARTKILRFNFSGLCSEDVDLVLKIIERYGPKE